MQKPSRVADAAILVGANRKKEEYTLCRRPSRSFGTSHGGDVRFSSPPLYCWPSSFRGVMLLPYLRPITDSNRIPSYQASATEPESNWHFLSPCDGCALLVARADLGRWHSTTGSSVPDFPLASSHDLSAHQGVSSLKFQRVSTAHSPTLAATSHDMSAHHHNGSKSQ